MLNIILENIKSYQKFVSLILKYHNSNIFQIKVNQIDEQRFTDAFQKVANRISIALIISALIIGSSLLMKFPDFQIFGISIAMFFFIIASLFGLWLAYKMVMKDEDFKRKK